jgi:hypothetical protein
MEPEKPRLGFELMKIWCTWLRRFRRIGYTPEIRVAARVPENFRRKVRQNP